MTSVMVQRPPEGVSGLEASSKEAPCRIWVDDPKAFSAARMSAIRHDYQRHPLMQMPALAALARDLHKTGQCRFLTPGTTQASAFDHKSAAHDGRSIDEVFRRIEEPGSWVALYNVETHPRYKDFLNDIAAGVRALVEPQQPGMCEVGGFIFISAPPSVTPFHIDRENNFWLQVHGRKQLTVWDHRDSQVIAQPDVERFIVYADLDNVKLREGMLERGTEFDCAPGDGVYFPSTSPHATRSDTTWVRPGDGVVVSIGVVFYTEGTRRVAYIHAGNMVLRRLGLNPAEPGRSAMHDNFSYWIGRRVIRFKQRFRGYIPKKGF